MNLSKVFGVAAGFMTLGLGAFIGSSILAGSVIPLAAMAIGMLGAGMAGMIIGALGLMIPNETAKDFFITYFSLNFGGAFASSAMFMGHPDISMPQ